MFEEKYAAIDVFQERLRLYHAMWRMVEARICALRKDGAYELLAMRAFLDDEDDIGRITLVDHPGLDIVMWKERMPIGQLDHLLSQLRFENAVQVGNRAVKLTAFEDRHWQCETYSGRNRGYLGVEYPHMVLYAAGKGFSDVADEGELLRQLEHFGYQGLVNTTEEKLGFPLGSTYSTQIYIAAPSYLAFDKVESSGTALDVSIEAYESLRVEDIELRYEITYVEDETEQKTSGSFCFREQDFKYVAGRFGLITHQIDVPADIVSAGLWINHTLEKYPIDSYWVRGGKVPGEGIEWSILDVFLEEKKGARIAGGHWKLRQYLGIDGPTDGSQFEAAVSNLLGSMSFGVLFGGYVLKTKGIDLMAICPDSGRVLAVSATISNNVHEKMRTLLPQLNELRRALPKTKLTGAVFSCVNVDDVLQTDKDDAKQHEIALILNAQITELFDVAASSEPRVAREKALRIVDESLSCL